MTYADKLKDPRWQKKRLEILELLNDFFAECFRMEAFHQGLLLGKELGPDL